MTRFSPNDSVFVNLGSNGVLPAHVIKNIDATCSPLTDMWLIKVVGWNRPFGIKGDALSLANRAH